MGPIVGISLVHDYIRCSRSTIFELCFRGNESASAMCGQIFPLGVCVRFGTMQVAGCRSGLAPDGGFGQPTGSSSVADLVYNLRPQRAVYVYLPIRNLSPLWAALSASGTVSLPSVFFGLPGQFCSVANLHFPPPHEVTRTCFTPQIVIASRGRPFSPLRSSIHHPLECFKLLFCQYNCTFIFLRAFDGAPLAHLETRRLWHGIMIHNFTARFAHRTFGTPKDNGVDASIDIFLVASLEYHLI